MEPFIGNHPKSEAREGSDQSFVDDVLEPSLKHPVIVAFGHYSSPQFKELVGVLERAVATARDGMGLVTINIETQTQVAAQLQLKAVPTTMAFVNGQPADGFSGMVAQQQAEAFVAKLAGSGGPGNTGQMLEAAREALAAGDLEAAAAGFQACLQADPSNPGALAGIIRCQLESGDTDGAAEGLAQVPAEHRDHPELAAVRAAIELARQVEGAGDIETLRQTVEKKPKDSQARFDLALALLKSGAQEPAIDELIEIVRREPEWEEEAARKQLVNIFESLGPANEITISGRRKLSLVLFA